MYDTPRFAFSNEEMCRALEGYGHFRIGVRFRLTFLEVRGPGLVIHLSQTPTFNRCVVKARCKNKTQQDYVFKQRLDYGLKKYQPF